MTDKYNIKKCKVLYYKNGELIFEFNGYGILEHTTNAKINKDNTIDIRYIGEIGKSNFKYKL